jgi:hypothetical protein
VAKKTFSRVFGDPTVLLLIRRGLGLAQTQQQGGGMAEESTYRLIFLLAGLVVLQTSPAARTQQPNQLGMRFPMIQIVTGETARVNAQNLEAGSSAKDSSCSVTLQFLDTAGRVVKQTVVVLRPGNVASLELSRAELQGDNPRVEIGAVLLFGYYGGAPPGPAIVHRFDCNIVPSLEVFDDHTGEMKLVLKDATPLPPPATPAQ